MENDTPTYNALFVFGDSLSDNGAIFAFTDGLFPPTSLIGTDGDGNVVDFDARGIFYDQKFTNGDVYADVAADLLGVASDTSTFYDDFSGSNLAVGGATATDLSTFGDTASNTFADQVATYQAAIAGLPGTDAEKAAFLEGSAASVFIGLNDLSRLAGVATAGGTIDQQVLASGVTTIVTEIAAQAQALAATGIGTIVLNRLPGGSFFPSSNALINFFGPGTAALFDSVMAQINIGLDSVAAALEAGGTNVEVVDFFSLAQEIQADQETFGFLTLENALPNSDPVTTLLITDVPIDQVGFIDPVHFTAELHEVFGAFQATTIGNVMIDGDDSGGITQGSDADETIFARGGRDIIRAEGGDDLIFAGAGNDAVFAGDGNDIAFGGTGNDLMFGQNGHDILSGGAGNDVLVGGDDNDVVVGNAGNDFMIGGGGDDVMVDGFGRDVVSAGSGDDIVIYLAPVTAGGTVVGPSDSFFGGTGDDTLLIVSEAAITDIDAFLMMHGVEVFGFESMEVVTSAELDAYDFGVAGAQVAMADLFGLI